MRGDDGTHSRTLSDVAREGWRIGAFAADHPVAGVVHERADELESRRRPVQSDGLDAGVASGSAEDAHADREGSVHLHRHADRRSVGGEPTVPMSTRGAGRGRHNERGNHDGDERALHPMTTPRASVAPEARAHSR
jgi:hypothetical protein